VIHPGTLYAANYGIIFINNPFADFINIMKNSQIFKPRAAMKSPFSQPLDTTGNEHLGQVFTPKKALSSISVTPSGIISFPSSPEK
jgi:hypothetical protein